MKCSLFAALLWTSVVLAMPRYVPRASFSLSNGQQALQQNAQFKQLTANSSCTTGTDACVNQSFAQCVGGKYVLQSCGSTLICAALPLVNSAGTSITCTTQADVDARIAATGATSASNSSSVSASAAPSSIANIASTASASAPSASASAGSGNGSDPQSSLTLLKSVVATGFEQNGQNTNGSEAGEVASATSPNNFINFCATVSNLPITNGQQIKTGSCNPAPMGVIASTANMPSAKFVKPANLGTVKANTNFTVVLAVKNLATGSFTNADANYFAAPQQVDGSGNIQGHSHIVIEQLTSLNQTTPTDPGKFMYFKGLNDPAQNGQLSTTVSGLPAGAYRMASINTAANHQPALVAVAQHGALDDMIYFTVQ